MAELALAAIALGPPTAELIISCARFYRNVRRFGRESEELSLRFQSLNNRYDSLHQVLFQKGKFTFVGAERNIFEELPVKDQQSVLEILKILPRLLYKYYLLEKQYHVGTDDLSRGQKKDKEEGKEKAASKEGGALANRTSPETVGPEQSAPTAEVPLSTEELRLIFDGGEYVHDARKHSSLFSISSITWAARGRHRAQDLNDAFEKWLKLIRDALDDAWYPLSFFEKYSNLQELEKDAAAIKAGVGMPAGLRKLLVNDAPAVRDLELKNVVLDAKPLGDGKKNKGIAKLKGTTVWVESLPYDLNPDGFLSDVLKRRFTLIAQLLNQQKDADLRVLTCQGWINRTSPRPEFQLLFQIPIGHVAAPVSLLEKVLTKSSRKPMLGNRFKLCHQLAMTIGLLHGVGWMHRALRSENILFFPKVDAEPVGSSSIMIVDKPYLCGFETSRPQDDFSTATVDDDIERDVYRHPKRWGTPKQVFMKHHDVYALGVIFLEIGLWEPALTVGGNNFAKRAYSSEQVAEKLKDQADGRLGHRCGEKFQQIVIRCLKNDFGIDNESDDGLETEFQRAFREDVIDVLEILSESV